MHCVQAGFGGVAFASLGVSLIVAREAGWRSAAGAFAVASGAVFSLCLGQLLRADATTVGAMDFALRLSQASALVALWAIHEIYRVVTSSVRGRLHKAVAWLLLLCATYALLSPGGILYGEILGVTVARNSWGEVLHAPKFRPEWGTWLATLAYALSTLRLIWLATRRVGPGSRLNRALMLVGALAFGASAARVVLVALGLSEGLPFTEAALPFVFAVAGFEALAGQRRWARERATAIDQVRQTEAKLAALLGHGQTLSGILKPDGTMVLANRRSLELMGIRHEDVVGKPYPETAWWKHSSTLQRRLRQSIERAAQGTPDRFQATYHLADGTEADIDFSMTPYRDETGAVVWLIPEGRDITELVRFEQRARDEQRLEVIGQLAGGVAHDFNNMLAGIMGAAELAQLQCKDARVRANLDVVIEASQRAAGLTKQLLAFARRSSARSEVFGMNQVISGALALFERTSDPNIIVRHEEIAANDRIQGDPNLMQSALMNLLVNARDAMPQGGVISVRTRVETLTEADTGRFSHPIEPGEYLRVAVSDTGTGISPETLPRIFEPFFTTKEIGKGTGLGLAGVVGCVRDHRGTLEVESVYGAGTTFVLHLPLASSAPRQHPDPGAGMSLRDGAGLRAVVVDDEVIVRNTTAQTLRQMGFTVDTFDNGAAALLQMDTMPVPPSVVLVDLHMRGMNGRDVVQALRRQSSEVPIILSSGNFGGWDLGTVRQDPHVRLLAKPARREELIEALLELKVLQRS